MLADLDICRQHNVSWYVDVNKSINQRLSAYNTGSLGDQPAPASPSCLEGANLGGFLLMPVWWLFGSWSYNLVFKGTTRSDKGL